MFNFKTFLLLMLCGSFHENQRKRNFEPFLKTVLANQSKNEEENEKKLEK